MSKITSLLAAAALLAAAGCASTNAADTERSLAAAGFQMKFAKTPQQIAKVESLPQRKLTPSPGPDGKNRFVYADAKYCKCVYVGTEAAYDRYQNISVNKQIAENEEIASENEEAAAMDWGAWGGWGPWN
jgi:hypothetical protein